MRLDAAGNPTGQWLFDHFVLSTQYINGKDIAYSQLTPTDLQDMLNKLFAMAQALDVAYKGLLTDRQASPRSLWVSFALPWLSPDVHSFTLPGTSQVLDFAVPADRLRAAEWYIREVRQRATSANWQAISLAGVYPAREDAVDAWGDAAYLRGVASLIRDQHMWSLWIPYYDAPHAWDAGMGFDVVNVQPSFSFRSAQYGGEVSAGRVPATAALSRDMQRSFEYELAGSGATEIEMLQARHYLHTAQAHGVNTYHTTYFVGLTPDLFDTVTTQAAVSASTWSAYQDLCDFIAGATVPAAEVSLPLTLQPQSDGSLAATTTMTATAMTAIRLDYMNTAATTPWAGMLEVSVDGPGGVRTGYACTATSESFNPKYSSVTAPLSVSLDTSIGVTSVTVRLTRQSGSPWPANLKIWGTTIDAYNLSDSIVLPMITSSRSVPTATYNDSQPSFYQYSAGKLTDGQYSQTGLWTGAETAKQVAWNIFDGRFDVVIDLGASIAVSGVVVRAHKDQVAAINEPHALSVLIGATPLSPLGSRSTMPSAGASLSLTSMNITPSSDPRQLSATASFAGTANGRYITISGLGSGWAMLDEIEVLDATSVVVSTGKSYRITRLPHDNLASLPPHSNDGIRLADRYVAPRYYSTAAVGITGDDGNGYVESTWLTPITTATNGRIWFTPPDISSGIVLPASLQMQWRNELGAWSSSLTGVSATHVLAPYFKCAIPAGSQVTGLRAYFPQNSWNGSWYMVTQISLDTPQTPITLLP